MLALVIIIVLISSSIELSETAIETLTATVVERIYIFKEGGDDPFDKVIPSSIVKNVMASSVVLKHIQRI